MFLINLHFPFSTVVIAWTAYTVYPSCAMQLSGVIPLRNGPCVVIVTARCPAGRAAGRAVCTQRDRYCYAIPRRILRDPAAERGPWDRRRPEGIKENGTIGPFLPCPRVGTGRILLILALTSKQTGKPSGSPLINSGTSWTSNLQLNFIQGITRSIKQSCEVPSLAHTVGNSPYGTLGN